MTELFTDSMTNDLNVADEKGVIVGTLRDEGSDPTPIGRNYEPSMVQAYGDGALLVPGLRVTRAEVAELYRYWWRRYHEAQLHYCTHGYRDAGQLAIMHSAVPRLNQLVTLLPTLTRARIEVDEVARLWRKAMPGQKLNVKLLDRMERDKPHPEPAARRRGLLDPRPLFRTFPPALLEAAAAEVKWQMTGVPDPQRESKLMRLLQFLTDIGGTGR